MRKWPGLCPVLTLGVVVSVASIAPPHPGFGQDSAIESLRRELEELRRREEENRERMKRLEREIERLQTSPGDVEHSAGAAEDAQQALERALGEIAGERPEPQAVVPSQPSVLAGQLGGLNLRLIDISFDILTAVGASTERNAAIRQLQGGAHDPRRRGFTLQQGELSLAGAVDPYVGAEAHAIFTTSGVELEEAFFVTQALPYHLQLEGGYFFTEFGSINPLHPHAWDWIDQPVIVSRLLGGEGLRAPGFRLAWLMPVPWFSELHFGMQNADEGELTLSFNGGGVGGRPAVDRETRSLEDLLYLARWNGSWDLTDQLTAVLGFSALYGPNATGDDGQTWIYGSDLRVRWRPADSFMGWPYVTWQTEVMKRDYTADWFLAGTTDGADGGGHDHGHTHGSEPEEDEDEFPNDLPGAILRDVGFYTQILYGFRWGWESGLRFEYAGGSRPSVSDGVLVSRQTDAFRDDRFRLSPLLTWRPTEFSRFRLQYNYDHARHLSGNQAHSFWLGAEVLYGAHAAHRF